MTRTQIQLPDHLYRELKALAEAREWSLAETLRRGAELLLERYPKSQSKAEEWQLPGPFNLGKADPFTNPDWRIEANMRSPSEIIGTDKKPKRRP
jgi:hypothetical protein